MQFSGWEKADARASAPTICRCSYKVGCGVILLPEEVVALSIRPKFGAMFPSIYFTAGACSTAEFGASAASCP